MKIVSNRAKKRSSVVAVLLGRYLKCSNLPGRKKQKGKRNVRKGRRKERNKERGWKEWKERRRERKRAELGSIIGKKKKMC